LPDRSSLALVIKALAAFAEKHWFRTPRHCRACQGDRGPHIGEYDAKTNAIRAFPPRPIPADNLPFAVRRFY
jgi:hypothetical protein